MSLPRRTAFSRLSEAVTIRLDPRVHESLRTLARNRGVDESVLIEQACEEYLKGHRLDVEFPGAEDFSLLG